MYSQVTTSGASALAVTGMAYGQWLLIAVAIVVAGTTLIALARRPKKVKP